MVIPQIPVSCGNVFSGAKEVEHVVVLAGNLKHGADEAERWVVPGFAGGLIGSNQGEAFVVVDCEKTACQLPRAFFTASSVASTDTGAFAKCDTIPGNVPL